MNKTNDYGAKFSSEWFTSNELTGLPGLPQTVQGVIQKAKRSNWVRRLKTGVQGKVHEYHIDCLPAEVQKVLRDRLAKQLLDDASVPAVVDGKASKNLAVRQSLEVMVKCPELALREVRSLSNKQKAIADARILLAAEVHKLRNFGGMTRTAAVKYIVEGVRMGRCLNGLWLQQPLRTPARGKPVWGSVLAHYRNGIPPFC